MANPYERSCETPKTSEGTQRIYRDEELMREALEALQPLAQCTEDSPSKSPDHRILYDGAFVGIVLGDARRARAAVTKLEERLLQE